MATTPAIIPDIEAQAKAQLPQVQATPPWEDEPRLLERPTSKMGVAFSRAKDWLAEHEKHFSETTLAPFRQGLDNMADELQRAGETGHTAAGGELSPVTRALVEGAGTLLRWTPVGSDVKETLSANIIPPELGPEGKAALKAKKVIDFSSIAGHVQLGEKAAPKEPPKPRLGPGKDFYSTLEHVVETKIPDKVSGEQLLSTLTNAGVSKREIEHVGIKDFATEPKHVNKLRDSIDKEEILAHVRERAPHVETVEKGGSINDPEYKAIVEKHANLNENLKQSLRNELGLSDERANHILETHVDLKTNLINELARKQSSGLPSKNAGEVSTWIKKHEADLKDFRESKEAMNSRGERNKSLTKYESYTLPGGSNYREVLLKLPHEANTGENLVVKQGSDGKFHLIDTNEDALIDRFDSAEEANTEKQNMLRNPGGQPPSGRAGAYGSEVYSGPHFDEPNVVAHLRLKDRTDVNGKKTLFIEELQSDWAREMREQKAGGPQSEEAAQRKEDGGVPDMPFDKSWHELALKKALHIAATEGYDQVAWTTGAQQAERYNLRNYVDQFELQPAHVGNPTRTPEKLGHYTLIARLKDKAMPQYFYDQTPEEIEKLIGGDNTKKLMSTGDGVLKPKDFAMGGEHHLRLYDEMVPQFLNKHTKKWSGKVGETQIELPNVKKETYQGRVNGVIKPAEGTNQAKVQTLPITPEMREGIKGGQPLLGADKLDFSSIQGHVQHTGVEGGESEMERLRRAPPREAPAKTPEEVKGETDRAETAAAEERLPKHLGGKAEPKEPTTMTPKEPDEMGRVTAVLPSRVAGKSVYEHITPEGKIGRFQFDAGKWKVGETIRGTKMSISDAAAQGLLDVKPKAEPEKAKLGVIQGGKAKSVPGHVELAVKKVEQLEPGDMGYMRADGTHVGQPTDPKWTGGQLTHEQLASREHEDLNKILDAGGVRYRIDAGKVNKSPAGSVQIVGLSEKSVTNAKRVIERMPTDNVIFESYPVRGGKPVTIEGTPKEVIAQINRHVRANQGERYDLGEVPGHVKESRDKLSGKKPLKEK